MLLYGQYHHRDDILGTGLAQYVFAVCADGIGTEKHGARDLIAAHALPYQLQYLYLSSGQVGYFGIFHIWLVWLIQTYHPYPDKANHKFAHYRRSESPLFTPLPRSKIHQTN